MSVDHLHELREIEVNFFSREALSEVCGGGGGGRWGGGGRKG